MKKIFYLSFVLFGLCIVSCKHQHPDVHITSLTLEVGDSSFVQVTDANDVKYQYSNSHNESTPVFSISNKNGNETTIYALNPGTDTLWISFRWNNGMYSYGELMSYTIQVIEKE